MPENKASSAKLLPMDAGVLIDLKFENEKWIFKFKNQFSVECYSSWRVVQHNYGAHTLIGSRDLVDAAEPFKIVNKHLSDCSMGAINFNGLTDVVQLQFLGAEHRITIDLFKTSAHLENWKFIGEDFEDTDKIGLLKNL